MVGRGSGNKRRRESYYGPCGWMTQVPARAQGGLQAQLLYGSRHTAKQGRKTLDPPGACNKHRSLELAEKVSFLDVSPYFASVVFTRNNDLRQIRPLFQRPPLHGG